MCPVMIITIYFEADLKKMVSGQKKQNFWIPKGPLWAIGAMKWPAEWPNGHLPENQGYQEFPQNIEELSSH